MKKEQLETVLCPSCFEIVKQNMNDGECGLCCNEMFVHRKLFQVYGGFEDCDQVFASTLSYASDERYADGDRRALEVDTAIDVRETGVFVAEISLSAGFIPYDMRSYIRSKDPKELQAKVKDMLDIMSKIVPCADKVLNKHMTEEIWIPTE